MRRLTKKNFSGLVVFLFLLVTLALALFLVQQTQKYLGRAAGEPANITVDAAANQGPIIPIWQSLAQGGEEKYPFNAITNTLSQLQPKYIRVDHIYDFYNVVKKEDGRLSFNWTELDTVVNQILKAGALPFFSLSYMPPSIARNGEITAAPNDWNDWATVVEATVEHYSGRQGRNLTDVAYEVWNEPDLFGNWRIGGEKDYRTLYRYAVVGANQAQNTNSFKIGGPAVTAPYANWVNGFLDYVVDNNLRIDFYSWHRYTLDPQKFLEDVNAVDSWLFDKGRIYIREYITEWGSVSENSPYHDTVFDAAHLVASIRQILQRVDAAFIFEIKDGPPPENKKYWGRWGLLTHENAGPVEKKPKFRALQLLNQMSGNRLAVQGEGTWVTGFAAKDGNKIKVILSNFDKNGRNYEAVPVTINNLENGSYSYKLTYLSGNGQTLNETITGGIIQKQIPLSTNNIALIELEKL